MTRLINIRNAPDGWQHNPEFAYIGRYNKGYGVRQSKWYNPFHVHKESERENAIKRYEDYIGRIDDFELHIEELRGKVLVCWCKPKACHGDVLLRLLGEIPTQLSLF